MARRTAILKAAARRGWEPLRETTITPQLRKDHPHLEHCIHIYGNNLLEVHVFACSSPIGGISQVNVRKHLDDCDLTWDALQRVKNELFGEKAIALEMYPPVDVEWRIRTNVRVLWIMPADYVPPFGLHLPAAWGRNED